MHPEDGLRRPHAGGRGTRVGSRVVPLQPLYLELDRRLPFLVRVRPLVDLVSAAALRYRLAQALTRVESIRLSRPGTVGSRRTVKPKGSLERHVPRVLERVPAHDYLTLLSPQVDRLRISFDQANQRHVRVQRGAQEIVGRLHAGWD